MIPPPSPLFETTGRPITLDPQPLGVGGEGAVYEVVGDPSQVAKIYHQLPGPEQVAKLRVTMRLASPTILKVAAWPTQPLHLSPGGPVAGFLMPKIAGFHPIHELYGPIDRKKYFPGVSWDFLIHTAQRCAEVFKTIHDAGHVLGDVNESNVYVSKQGIVRLIDCDSFQVRDAIGKVFRCEVGVDLFIPPELQGRSLATIDRTENHDRFGLAVLIFQLLMMGRHPYAGVYSGPGDMFPPQAISTGRFAYSRSPVTTQMNPPPNSPPIRLLDGPLFNLFERAFTSGATTRPAPSEWDQALTTFRGQLRKCSTDPRHVYPRPLGACPWCEFIVRIGHHFFLPSPVAAAKAGPSFDFALVWTQIDAIWIARFNYVRPTPTRVSGLNGKPIPAALAGHPASFKPLPATLGDHAARPTLQVLAGFDPDSPPAPPPTSFGLHAPRPIESLRPTMKEHAARPQPLPDDLGVFAKRPQPPIHHDFGCLPIALMLTGLVLLCLAPRYGHACLYVGLGWLILLGVTASSRREKREKSVAWQHQLRLVEDWEVTQRVWEEGIRKAKQADQSAWDRAQRKWELDNISRDKAEYAQWEARLEEWQRKQGEWVERQRAGWVAARRAWEVQKARYDGLRLDYENQIRVWTIKQANWEQRIRAQWELDYREWRVKEQVWQQELQDRKLVRESIVGTLKNLEANYERQWNASFDSVKIYRSKLNEVRDRYVPVLSSYEAKRRELAGKVEENQRREYLRSFIIADANIERLTSKMLASLQSFGIETAWEVDILEEYKVPDIGSKTKGRLIAWRNWHVSKFRFNPNLPSPELMALERSHRTTVAPWEAELAAGPGRLRGVAAQMQTLKETATRQIQSVVDQLQQAEMDVTTMMRTVT